MKYLVFGGVGAGMLVVLLAVIVLQNRKKKTGAPTGQNNYVKATGPVWQGAAGAADPVEDYAGETSPIQGYGNVNFEERERVAQAKPVCFLMGVGGVMNGRKYPLTGKEITIGRYQTNVICYPENAPGVSRSHARLYMDGDRIMLMDCNSSGGTYLKRTGRLQTMHPVEVNIGDVFYIGEKRNGFEIRQ